MHCTPVRADFDNLESPETLRVQNWLEPFSILRKSSRPESANDPTHPPSRAFATYLTASSTESVMIPPESRTHVSIIRLTTAASLSDVRRMSVRSPTIILPAWC